MTDRDLINVKKHEIFTYTNEYYEYPGAKLSYIVRPEFYCPSS